MISADGLVALLFGLVVGSFLNVCISRVPRKVSVVAPRSRCPKCEAPIRWRHNIPLLSYLVLRGRCADCSEPIGISYPVVEILSGLAFLLAQLTFGWSLLFVVNACFFSALIVLAVIDLFERILPDVITLNGTVLAFLVAPLQARGALEPIDVTAWPAVNAWVASGVGILAGGGTLWLVASLYFWWRKVEGLGFGDVKLMALVGAFLGWKGAWLTIFAGSISGALIGSLYIVLSSSGRQYELPFGTFLAFAAVLAGVYGPGFVTWYAGML